MEEKESGVPLDGGGREEDMEESRGMGNVEETGGRAAGQRGIEERENKRRTTGRQGTATSNTVFWF